MMKTTQLSVQGMEELSPSACGEISGGARCVTGSDGNTYRVERTVDSNGHVTLTVTRAPLCRVGGA